MVDMPGGLPVSGVEVIRATRTVDPADTHSATAACPPGKKVIGGGFHVNVGVVVSASMPSADQAAWVVTAHNPTNFREIIEAVAICAPIA